MRIARYLLKHKLALLVVVLCFVIQAVCELSLPRYTSDIVDIGLQQSGVEHASPEYLSAQTHDDLLALLDDEAAQAVLQAYAKNDEGVYELRDTQEQTRALLDEVMALSMVLLMYANQTQALEAGQAQNDSLRSALDAYKQKTMSQEELRALANEQLHELAGYNETVIAQQAINAAKAEYVALGISFEDKQMSYLLRVGAIMLALVLFAALIHCVMNFFACRTASKIGRDLRKQFFEKVVSFSASEIDQFSAASLITRGTNDIQFIQMTSLMMQRMVVYSPILAIGGIIMVLNTSVSFSWIIALGVVLIFLVLALLFAITMPKFKIMQTLIDKVNLVSRELLTGLNVVRAFNRETYEEDRFKQANEALMKTQLFTNRAMSFMMPVMMLIMNLISVLIVWLGGHYVDAGEVQTGDLIAFITYAMVIISSFLIIGMIAIMLPRASVTAERVDEVINTAISIEDALRVYDDALDTSHGVSIEFKDVSFRYSETSENALEHISFTAEPGKTFAVIGATGCGKSSILKLIERFYDVNEGAVLLNGIDIRSLSLNKLHSLLGYVPQQSFLFSGTIESNVLYGNKNAGESRALEAIDIAQARAFVEEKPEALQSEIAQGGTNVSGGQRQRLAIARALASDASVYLFDDSFSALDYKTDATLRHELKRRLSDKTVIIVAQRISTIMDADTILVLEDGKMAGLGTHEELLERCEAYREIAYSQLSEAELAKGGVHHGA